MRKTIFKNTQGPFLTVYRLLKIGKLSICIHKFDQPDENPDCHDHPFHFFTMVLKGWYLEEFYNGDRKFRRMFSCGLRDAGCLHKVSACSKPVWTLCIKWDANRRWGFMVREEEGVIIKVKWVYWEDYIKAKGLTPISKSEEAY